MTTQHPFILLFILVAIIYSARYYFLRFAHDMEVEREWSTHLENYNFSVLAFYDILEEVIANKKIPGIVVARVALFESDWPSQRRVYIRISKRKVIFLICAFKMGCDFYISYKLGYPKTDDETSSTNQPTLYEHDADKAFKESIHKGIMKSVQVMVQHYGYRA